MNAMCMQYCNDKGERFFCVFIEETRVLLFNNVFKTFLNERKPVLVAHNASEQVVIWVWYVIKRESCG